MEYGQTVCNGEVCDFNYTRHVGWSEGNECIRGYYSPQTVNLISRKVTELTMGVDPKNRPIIVPNVRICEVMDDVYQSFTPSVGDIYSRYIVPNGEQEDMVQSMIDQTIEIITSSIRNDLGIQQNNQKLSAWVQVLGDFNQDGLRSHDIIKVREKRPTPMQFHLNY
uniref:Uncharacterized protein n=1 Tax=viral metagenome TaxID=1070528 RepID=A0A6C0EK33_9ZZZZ